jgi:AcrR family transcriptional regulator
LNNRLTVAFRVAISQPVARPANTDAAVTRQRILDAALDQFAERGFYGTTMRNIGAAAGITGSALYHHFPSKEALLADLYAMMTTFARSYGPWNLVELDKPPPLKQVLAVVCKQIITIFELPIHQKFFRLMLNDGVRLAQEGLANTDRLMMEPRRQLSTMMARLMDAGLVRRMDADLAAMEFLGPLMLYRQFKLVWGVPLHTTVLDHDAFVAHHVECMVRAFSPGKR